ncbi:PAC2 domain containing protein, partial [Marine Group I thaumarchaeote SCGC AAA799-D11]
TKIPALVLYAECHPFFPDPEASIVAIETLANILDVKVDIQDIKNKIDKLRIQHRNLMEETIRTLQQQQEKQGKTPQIYR